MLHGLMLRMISMLCECLQGAQWRWQQKAMGAVNLTLSLRMFECAGMRWAVTASEVSGSSSKVPMIMCARSSCKKPIATLTSEHARVRARTHTHTDAYEITMTSTCNEWELRLILLSTDFPPFFSPPSFKKHCKSWYFLMKPLVLDQGLRTASRPGAQLRGFKMQSDKAKSRTAGKIRNPFEVVARTVKKSIHRPIAPCRGNMRMAHRIEKMAARMNKIRQKMKPAKATNAGTSVLAAVNEIKNKGSSAKMFAPQASLQPRSHGHFPEQDPNSFVSKIRRHSSLDSMHAEKEPTKKNPLDASAPAAASTPAIPQLAAVGLRVMVKGLSSAVHYNGQYGIVGEIVDKDGEERLVIVLENGRKLSVRRANAHVVKSRPAGKLGLKRASDVKLDYRSTTPAYKVVIP